MVHRPGNYTLVMSECWHYTRATYGLKPEPFSHCWQRTVYGQVPAGASLAKLFPLLATYSIRSSTYWSLVGKIFSTAGNVQYTVRYLLEPLWRNCSHCWQRTVYGQVPTGASLAKKGNVRPNANVWSEHWDNVISPLPKCPGIFIFLSALSISCENYFIIYSHVHTRVSAL